jgi:NAD(P)H-flavin reductase
MTIAEISRITPPPADAMIPERAVIESIRREAAGVITLQLRIGERDFRFLPGQFNMLWLPAFGESAISISSDPQELRTIGHTIRFAGSVTRAIGRLKAGDVLGVRGPFGSGWPLDRAKGRDLMIAAGGIGLAPLRPVICEIMHRRDDFGRVLLLYGGRSPADLLFGDEFDSWKRGGIELHVTVDRGDGAWKGHVGVVPLLFYHIKLDAKETVVFTCGPEVMMRFVIFEAMARRVPPSEIWVSLERNMKCGIGVCGHCQFGPTFLCKEGPVLPYSAVERFFLKEEF